MKKDGLFAYLKRCQYESSSSLKTKTIIRLFQKLLDNNKSHQVDDLKKIWRSENPVSIKNDYNFGEIIKKESTLKENIFVIIEVYLDGKLI